VWLARLDAKHQGRYWVIMVVVARLRGEDLEMCKDLFCDDLMDVMTRVVWF